MAFSLQSGTHPTHSLQTCVHHHSPPPIHPKEEEGCPEGKELKLTQHPNAELNLTNAPDTSRIGMARQNDCSLPGRSDWLPSSPSKGASPPSPQNSRRRSGLMKDRRTPSSGDSGASSQPLLRSSTHGFPIAKSHRRSVRVDVGSTTWSLNDQRSEEHLSGEPD